MKEVIPDEELEILRDGCIKIRDLAIVELLGHQQIDTTMHYAMVNQSNVKNSH